MALLRQKNQAEDDAWLTAKKNCMKIKKPGGALLVYAKVRTCEWKIRGLVPITRSDILQG